jgi:hypothetical protein
VNGSDEEVDDPPEVDSDEDLSDDDDKHDHEEVCIRMFYYNSYILTLFIKKILYIKISRRKNTRIHELILCAVIGMVYY